MNDKRRKALLESLSQERNIEDDYLKKRPKRMLFFVTVLLVIICLITFINISGKKKEKETNIYENDNTKTFSKDFINSVRYGYITKENNVIEYNCNYDKKTVDKLTKECLENNHLNKCTKFDDDKQFCFSFTKRNVETVEIINLYNPDTIKELKEFSNLKTVNIDLGKEYIKYNNLFSELDTLTKNKDNLSLYIYISDISDDLFKLSEDKNRDYKNVYICLFDKEVCSFSGQYVNYQEMIKVLNTIKGVKNDLNEEFKKPSDLEKVIFIYNYMINNLKVDKIATINEDNLNRENMRDTLNKKLVSYLAINEEGTYYSLTNYFDILARYIGLKTSIGTYIDKTNNKEYIYNEVNISGKWYNISIEKEINNLNIDNQKYNYLLKSDDEFKTNLNAELKNNKESSASIDINEIDSIISKIR